LRGRPNVSERPRCVAGPCGAVRNRM
jgi:hypothetical protein